MGTPYCKCIHAGHVHTRDAQGRVFLNGLAGATMTVATGVFRGAFLVDCLVLLARHLGNAVLLHKLVRTTGLRSEYG